MIDDFLDRRGEMNNRGCGSIVLMTTIAFWVGFGMCFILYGKPHFNNDLLEVWEEVQ